MWSIKAIYIQITAVIVAIIFLIVGAYKFIKSLNNKYSIKELYDEILHLNEADGHPFSIILIRNSFDKFPNKYLLFYDVNWDCQLFLNYHMASEQNIEDEMAKIINLISTELHIETNNLKIKYLLKKDIKKYSVSDKIRKLYNFYFFYVDIKKFRKEMKSDSFYIDGKKYYWRSIVQMEDDSNIMKKNKDVIKIVKNDIRIDT